MNRLEQSIILPLFIIFNILVNIILLLSSPFFWLGAIFWSEKTFTKMFDFWFENITTKK